MTYLRITNVSFRPAPSADVSRGMLGWASFLVDGALKVGSVAVRRTRSNSLTLSFPTRRDNIGIEHGICVPVDEPSHREIEATVLAELRRQGVLE